jgi:hypothetical protein
MENHENFTFTEVEATEQDDLLVQEFEEELKKQI